MLLFAIKKDFAGRKLSVKRRTSGATSEVLPGGTVVMAEKVSMRVCRVIQRTFSKGLNVDSEFGVIKFSASRVSDEHVLHMFRCCSVHHFSV